MGRLLCGANLIKMISAISSNGVIGKEGQLPWHLPEDLKRFKQLTIGHNVVMGRKTFDSLPKLLSDRKHIVLTRNNFYDEEIDFCSDVSEVLSKYEDFWVIGGSEIYQQFMPYYDEIYLTIIKKEYEGDAFSPAIPFWEYNSVIEYECEEYSFIKMTRER